MQKAAEGLTNIRFLGWVGAIGCLVGSLFVLMLGREAFARKAGLESPLRRELLWKSSKDQREIQGWADEIASAVRTHLA